MNSAVPYDWSCMGMSSGPQGVPRGGTLFVWQGAGPGKAHQSANANPRSGPKPRAFTSHSRGLTTLGSGYSSHRSGSTNPSFFRHQQLHVLACRGLSLLAISVETLHAHDPPCSHVCSQSPPPTFRGQGESPGRGGQWGKEVHSSRGSGVVLGKKASGINMQIQF